MLRKSIHIVISLLLLTSTMGFTLSAHYCGDNLKSVSVLADPGSCCDIPDGCCHDETETFRIDEDFASAGIHFDPKISLLHVLDYYIPVTENLSVKYLQLTFIEEPPPPTTQQVLSNLQVYIL